MADEVQVEHTLGWRERLLLERLVRGLEQWVRMQVAQVPPDLRAAIDAMAKEADQVAIDVAAKEVERVAQHTQEPPQGA